MCRLRLCHKCPTTSSTVQSSFLCRPRHVSLENFSTLVAVHVSASGSQMMALRSGCSPRSPLILRAEFSFSPRLPSLNVCVYLLIFPPNLLVPQHPVSSTEVLSSDAGHSPAACVKPHPSTPPQPTGHQDFAFPGHRTVHPQPVLALQTAVLSSLMARHLPASSAIRVTASRPPVTRHTPSSVPPASLCSGWCHC